MNYSTKKELAMAYCPDIDYTAALKKLNQWIRTNAELSARLAATGYIPTQRRCRPVHTPKLEMILWLLMQNLHFIVLLFCAKIRKK